MNILAPLIFYLIKVSKVSKIFKAKKKMFNSIGLSGGEDSPREEACGGPGVAGHLQDGFGGLQGRGGGPEGLAGDGPDHLGGQVKYIFLKPPLPSFL